MSVWKCPHCKSVQIIVCGLPRLVDDDCSNFDCSGVMEQLEDPEASNAVYDALYGSLERTSIASQIEGAKAFNESLKRFLATLEAQS
jgi:hypothetical protein